MNRRRHNLTGRWTCQPIAWLTLQADGSLHAEDRPLPEVRELPVPANWDATQLRGFAGRARYTRTFDSAVVPEGGSRVWLTFDAVDYFTEVDLNGVAVGSHEGAFQPFAFDVTDALVDGTNTLEVTVTSPREQPGTVWPQHKRMIKGVYSHWDCRPGSWSLEHGQDRPSGGIWGDVHLEARATTTIQHVRSHTRLVPEQTPEGEARTALESTVQKAMVTVETEIVGDDGVVDVVCRIGDLASVHRRVVVRDGRTSVACVADIVDPPLWWTWDVGDPHLETLTVEISRDGAWLDTWSRDIGLRELRFDQDRGEWWLNGRRVFLRGTNMVPVLWPGTYDEDTAERDVELLRHADINGVRACVHVADPRFYDMCDQRGLIVWQDFPLQWGYAPTNAFIEDAMEQLTDMIRLLEHRPCIGVWCCQNESTFHNKYVMDPLLADTARAADSSRYVRPTSLFNEHAYLGWYDPDYRAYADLPATPVVTEFGAQAFPSPEVASSWVTADASWDADALAYHGFQRNEHVNIARLPINGPWQSDIVASQQHQARCLKFAVERYRKAKYVRLGGLFQFQFVDAWPAVTWSVVDHLRVPKEGYRALAEAYQRTLIAADVVSDDGHNLHPWIVNDRHERLEDCQWQIDVMGADEHLLEHRSGQVTLDPDGLALELPPVSLGADEPLRIRLLLTWNGSRLSETWYDGQGDWVPLAERPDIPSSPSSPRLTAVR